MTGEVVEQGRGAKILVFHYKRKKQYKKLRGHRQGYTAVRITEIAFDGQKFTAPELPEERSEAEEGEAGRSRRSSQGRGQGGQEPGEESSSQEGSAQESSAKKEKVAPASSTVLQAGFGCPASNRNQKLET